MIKYLSHEDLVHLANYKYKSGSYTFLDNALTPFWNWVVSFVPLWMAPNMVTLIGLLCCVVGHVVMIYYSQDFTARGVPGWALVLFAIVLFIYQTMDAIDGKQARRTMNSSPLGQLFDHGCDAFIMSLITPAVLIAIDAGVGVLSVAFIIHIMIPFALSQLEEYHTGVLKTSNGGLGVTEAQIFSMLVFLFGGFFGQSGFWSFYINLSVVHEGLGFTLAQALMLFVIVGNVVFSMTFIVSILQFNYSKLPIDEKGNKSLSRLSAFAHLFPFAMYVLLSCYWAISDSQVFARYPMLLSYCISISGCLITTKLIVAHMAKKPYSSIDTSLLPLAMAAINSNPALYNKSSSHFDEHYFGLFCLFLVLLMYFHYVFVVIIQIKGHLGIRSLHINPPSPPPPPQKENTKTK